MRSRQCTIRPSLRHCESLDCIDLCNMLGDYFVFEANIREAKTLEEVKKAIEFFDEVLLDKE